MCFGGIPRSIFLRPRRSVQVVGDASGKDVELPYTPRGVSVNSASAAVTLEGRSTAEASSAAIEWLAASGAGAATVTYKLRDWLFARQRYWGEPFPVVYPEGSDTAVPLPLDQLPVRLPDLEEFKPSGNPESPLVNATEWLQATDPVGGGPARRDTNTMPQWAGSCWYYLRYIDPDNNGMCDPASASATCWRVTQRTAGPTWFTCRMVDPELEKYWMPVDLYVGGAEHAVLHLLYARFWHKVLYDLGVVHTKEPFHSLVSQGMILGETEYSVWRDTSGAICDAGAEGAIKPRHPDFATKHEFCGWCLNCRPATTWACVQRLRVSIASPPISKDLLCQRQQPQRSVHDIVLLLRFAACAEQGTKLQHCKAV